jgi:hypothetical protein
VLTELQRPGRGRMPVAEFLAGMPLRVGETLVGRPTESGPSP